MNRFLSVLARPARVLLRLPMKLVAAPRRIWGLSLPNRIAVVTALIVIVIVSALCWMRTSADDAAKFYANPGFWVWLILLAIAIPFAVRWWIIAWLEGPVSHYPEIDRAWEAGLTAMREKCLDPAEIPIFVVHGLKDERQANSLIEASEARFPVNGVPSGVAELHWYASSDAILLVCMGQSQITALANASATAQREEGSPRNMRDTLRGTIQAMELDQLRQSAKHPGPTPARAPALGGANLLTKTLVPSEESGGGSPAKAAGSSSASLRQINAHELTAKLDHVCQRLRRLRQPACPINGILSVLPLELAIDSSVDQSQVQQAMRGDLEGLRRGLQLRCPAVTLVAGMETEIGFRELVRRVGSEFKHNRFGKGVNVWSAPSPEQVEAVTANACVSFDIFAYRLFREENGLTKPGNPKLYSLICRIRTELRERLQNILVGAYAHGSGPQDVLKDDPLLFGGCYFAETGDRPDLQAFVRGVLDLLLQSQDKLEWTAEAKRDDAFYRRLASAGFVLDGILLVALVGAIVFMVLNRP